MKHPHLIELESEKLTSAFYQDLANNSSRILSKPTALLSGFYFKTCQSAFLTTTICSQ